MGGGGIGFSQLFPCPWAFSFPPQLDPAESPPPSVATFQPRNKNALSYILPSGVTWHEQIPSRGFGIPISLGGPTPSALHRPKQIWPSNGGVQIFPSPEGPSGYLWEFILSANLCAFKGIGEVFPEFAFLLPERQTFVLILKPCLFSGFGPRGRLLSKRQVL